MQTTKKHAIWFHACILYSIWYVCVGGPTSIFFSGGPQSSSYGPVRRALVIQIWKSGKVCIWIRVIQSDLALKPQHKRKMGHSILEHKTWDSQIKIILIKLSAQLAPGVCLRVVVSSSRSHYSSLRASRSTAPSRLSRQTQIYWAARLLLIERNCVSVCVPGALRSGAVSCVRSHGSRAPPTDRRMLRLLWRIWVTNITYRPTGVTQDLQRWYFSRYSVRSH